jgi:outer membrane protein OmpA-like peptidoglycan-associated protein
MTRNRISVLFAALAIAGLAQAAETPAKSGIPATPQGWVARMLDSTQNASAFKDPAVFNQWVKAMMDPATAMVLMQQGMDPTVYARMSAAMMNPATLQNYMQFLDPAVYARWLGATMDPNFYNALLAQGMNPANYLNWMALPMNPQMWNLGMQMLNPAMYMNWLTAPMNPAMLNSMMMPLNPNMYMNWLGTGMRPSTYGPWGEMMSMPAAPAATAAPAAPASPNPAEVVKKVPEAVQATVAKVPLPAVTTTKAVLAADALFKINTSGLKDLSKEGTAKLDEIADKIKALGKVEQVRIVGHADFTGRAEYNRKLSEARARSIKSYLIARGVKPDVIITSGVGDSQPVVQCDKSLPKDKLVACLAPNRRVEIEVVGQAK